MKRLSFPSSMPHAPHHVQNVNEILDQQITPGERAADKVAAVVGSWQFIIAQGILLLIWVILNVTAWINHWDPYPFILLNLFLSMEAAFTAPVIMMSQNRQAVRDRLEAQNDYLVNKKAEEEIRLVLAHLDAQNEAFAEIHRLLLPVGEDGRNS